MKVLVEEDVMDGKHCTNEDGHGCQHIGTINMRPIDCKLFDKHLLGDYEEMSFWFPIPKLSECLALPSPMACGHHPDALFCAMGGTNACMACEIEAKEQEQK